MFPLFRVLHPQKSLLIGAALAFPIPTPVCKAIPPYIDKITDITSDAKFILLVEKDAGPFRSHLQGFFLLIMLPSSLL